MVDWRRLKLNKVEEKEQSPRVVDCFPVTEKVLRGYINWGSIICAGTKWSELYSMIKKG